MKKIFTFVICAVMALPVFSKGIFTESFEREVGNLDKGNNTNMGTDVDNWWLTTGTTHIQVVEDNLTYTGYCNEATGKAIQISGSNGKAVRALKGGGITGGSIYYSCLINVKTLKNSTSKDYLIALLDNGSTTAKYCFAELRTINDYANNTYQLGITKAAEAFPRFSKPLQLNTTYLVVVRYDFIDGDKNDKAYLWINPSKDDEFSPLIECAQDTINGVGDPKGANTVDDAKNLTMCYLKPGSYTPTSIIIDELKVATTWDDLEISDGDTPVVKPELDVTPSSIDFGKYISGQTYSKTFTVTGANLKDDITISKSALSNISVSPTSIDKDNADLASGVTVTVTIEENRQYDFLGTISVKSGDLEKTVSVKGTEQVITYKDINQFSEFSADTETEDVIFTYKGTSATISSIDEINQQIILKDVSNNTIAVQLSAAQWEGINPVVGMRINELVFTAEKITVPSLRILATPITISVKGPDYTREITSTDYGTICVKGIVQTATLESIDATFYKILYKEGDPDAPTNIVLEEVTELEENTPYIFKPNSTGTWKIYSKNAVSDQPNSENGLIGTFTSMTIEAGMYLIYNNMVCKAGTGCDVAANRAYINMSQVPTKEDGEPKAAPGMNRVSLVNPNGIPGSTTGCKTLNAKANYRKVMMGGNLVIINNDKKINVLGQTVK